MDAYSNHRSQRPLGCSPGVFIENALRSPRTGGELRVPCPSAACLSVSSHGSQRLFRSAGSCRREPSALIFWTARRSSLHSAKPFCQVDCRDRIRGIGSACACVAGSSQATAARRDFLFPRGLRPPRAAACRHAQHRRQIPALHAAARHPAGTHRRHSRL